MAERAEQRTAHLSELATELDLDLDALTTALDALHEEFEARRATLREELADATPDERRQAMLALREDRQAQMRAALVELGADPEAVDALLAEHAASRPDRLGRAAARFGRGL